MRSGSKISAVAIAAVLLLSGCNNVIPTPESDNATNESNITEVATTNADDLSVTSSITTSDSSVTDNTDIFEQITDTSMPDPGIGPMYGTSPEKDRIYTYETDITEPLGDDAFRIPVDESFPVFFSDHYAEKKVGNELYIGSIFKSSGLYVGDEFADALKNCNGKHITVTLKDIEISMAVNEADNSKATLTTVEEM